jgi:protein phosphatase
MHVLAIPDPSVVVLVGPAGSGKSTLAARLFAADETLSSDAYRKLISGDAADQRASGLAFRRLHDELAVRAAARRLAVIDATNLTRHARQVLLARARDAGLPVVAIVLDLPPATVQARNAARLDRVVPHAVVADQLRRLRDLLDPDDPVGTLVAEGFHTVVILRDPLEVDELRIDRART